MMSAVSADHRFGLAWLGFAFAIGWHVWDEATHDFLSVYNPNALAFRARLPFLPLPTFTFRTWLTALLLGIALLLCLLPFALRGARWLRVAAVPLAMVFGVFNACLHLWSSAHYHHWMPGVYSSPGLLLAAVVLLRE